MEATPMFRGLVLVLLVGFAAEGSAMEFRVGKLVLHLPNDYVTLKTEGSARVFGARNRPIIVARGLMVSGTPGPDDREMLIRDVIPGTLDDNTRKGDWKIVQSLQRVDLPNGCSILSIGAELTESGQTKFLIVSSVVAPDLTIINVNIQGLGALAAEYAPAVEILKATSVDP
jgi:hypothetical protein